MKGMTKLNTRISSDEYYIRIAYAASQRSTCRRAQVGAVLVYDDIILGTGYNGSLPGYPHCDDETCNESNHCLRTTHAEINALHRAVKAGWVKELENATLFVTHRPCYSCAKTLAAFGLKDIVYDRMYKDEKAEEYFKIAKMTVFEVE